jgi:hypothetical protein
MSHADLVALAAALTALVAVPAALLIFFLDRGLSQRKTPSDITAGTAVALLIISAYTFAIDGGAWWAWMHVTARTTSLAGVPHGVAYGLAFGPPAVLAALAGLWALWRLFRRGYRAITATSP